jgi:hypothetical protein
MKKIFILLVLVLSSCSYDNYKSGDLFDYRITSYSESGEIENVYIVDSFHESYFPSSISFKNNNSKIALESYKVEKIY